MARETKDFLTQVREQAERTLAILTSEIRKREAELEKLLEQARVWRDALTSSFTLAPAATGPKRAPKKRTAKKKASKAAPRAAKKLPKKAAERETPARKPAAGAKKKRKATAAKKVPSGGRVDWDKILASLPATFTIDDVMADPGATSKGRNQVYPAINRWVNAKKARKVGTGRYKRVG